MEPHYTKTAPPSHAVQSDIHGKIEFNANRHEYIINFLLLSLLYLHFNHFYHSKFLLSHLMGIDETVKFNHTTMTSSRLWCIVHSDKTASLHFPSQHHKTTAVSHEIDYICNSPRCSKAEWNTRPLYQTTLQLPSADQGSISEEIQLWNSIERVIGI